MPRAAVCASSLSACAAVLLGKVGATADVLNTLGTCCLSKQEPQEQHVLPDHLLQGWWQEWCCL